MENIVASLINMGGLGILSLVLWKLLQELNVTFKLAHDASLATFKSEQKETRELFKAEQKSERDLCDRHFTQLADHMNKSHEAQLRTSLALEQNTKLLEDHHKLAVQISQKVEDHFDKQ